MINWTNTIKFDRLFDHITIGRTNALRPIGPSFVSSIVSIYIDPI